MQRKIVVLAIAFLMCSTLCVRQARAFEFPEEQMRDLTEEVAVEEKPLIEALKAVKAEKKPAVSYRMSLGAGADSKNDSYSLGGSAKYESWSLSATGTKKTEKEIASYTVGLARSIGKIDIGVAYTSSAKETDYYTPSIAYNFPKNEYKQEGYLKVSRNFRVGTTGEDFTQVSAEIKHPYSRKFTAGVFASHLIKKADNGKAGIVAIYKPEPNLSVTLRASKSYNDKGSEIDLSSGYSIAAAYSF